MKEHLTPDRIANSILQKTGFKGSYLIVEGNSDYTLYKKFTSENTCFIEIAFGNTNVMEVIELLNSRGFNDAIGIIDSDFRQLDNEFPDNPNILMTDDHDLELMIIKSEAFDTVLNHHCENLKVATFKKECGTDLRDYFLYLSAPLGYLKWANKRNGFALTFKPQSLNGKDLDYSAFIPTKTLVFLSYSEMVRTVINYSVNKGKINTTHKDAEDAAKSLIDNKINKYQLCNGHDICQIISLALQRKIGSHNANAIPATQIERELIFAYDSRYFQATNLYRNIKTWESVRMKAVLSF